MNTHLLRLLIPALATLLAGPALATHLTQVSVGLEGNMMLLDDSQLSCDDQAGTCSLTAPVMGGGGMWQLSSASLTLDPDPSVLAITAITNTSAATQTFVISVTLPIAPAFGPPSLIQGSVSGSVTDTSSATGLGTVGDASVAAVSGGSIYSALIDAAVVRTLLGDPFAASVVATPNGSATVGPADFGTPIRESVAVATTTAIGITLRFNLSPGDSASFTSVFDVIPVPEPSVTLLLGGGLVALSGLRMRRKLRH